ncbi:MAG: enoyl-[acyl-carrier-protein] reductase FabK [bacterium]
MSVNELCHLLNLTYPVIQGGMAWVSSPRLAAAVSEAGGLGVLAAGNMPPELFRQQIQETKKLTSKPFGANIVLLSPTAEEAIKVILEEWVPVVFFGGGNPSPYIEKLKAQGMKVVPVLASVSLAKRVERYGADAVVAEGWESGGHVGDISTLCLVPQVVDAVKIPVIAAGGIADNRGFRAALALGASGVQVGTRFICSTECEVHPLYKARILKAGDRDTVVTGYSTGHPVRIIKNSFSRIYAEKEKAGASPEELDLLGQGRLRMATVEGDVENGSVMSGAIAGLIKEIKPVKEIILEIVRKEE